MTNEWYKNDAAGVISQDPRSIASFISDALWHGSSLRHATSNLRRHYYDHFVSRTKEISPKEYAALDWKGNHLRLI